MHHKENIEIQLGKLEVGTVVRLKRTNEFAIIKEVFYLMNKQNFLHYLAIIEGRGEGLYALYDADIEVECLPTN